MSLLIKNAPLFLAIILTGLSAGLFYAWQVSVIPGTKLVTDKVYLESMQSINRAIINPGFIIIFLGSMLMLAIASYTQYGNFSSFVLVASAAVCYLIGTIGVTGMGNVPMNEALDAVDLTVLNDSSLKELRGSYEGRWNMLHAIRTAFSVIAFILALLSAFANIKTTA